MTTTKKPARTRKSKTSTKQNAESKKTDEKLVTIDRRRANKPVALERRKKVNRRRQIDPTTCERDYAPDEIEFMSALDEYKRTNGRMFPTCSEVLEVIKKLGYVKQSLPPVVLPESQTLHQAGVGSPVPLPGQTATEVFEPMMI